MSFFPNALENLIDQFAALPGVGRKSAQRLAFHVLSLPEEEALKFAAAIVDAKKNIHCCSICQNLTDQETCTICASPKRDQSTICVVAQPRDVLSFERSREYNGVYHVLHGVLSPMNHIGPDDIRIQELVKRVAAGGITEVIMATNPDTEGEATAMYIARLLKPFDVKITRRHSGRLQSGICGRCHAPAGAGRPNGNVTGLTARISGNTLVIRRRGQCISYIFFEKSTSFRGSSLPESERKGDTNGIQIENHPARRAR